MDRTFTIQVEEDDLRNFFYNRYKEVESCWGNDAKNSLFEQFVDFTIEYYNCDYEPNNFIDIITDVDNYMINSEIVELSEFSIGGAYEESFNIFDGNWEEFCNYNGIIFNDKYCLIRL